MRAQRRLGNEILAVAESAAPSIPKRPAFPILPARYIWPEVALSQIGSQLFGWNDGTRESTAKDGPGRARFEGAHFRAVKWLSSGELQAYLYQYDLPSVRFWPIPADFWLTIDAQKLLDWNADEAAWNRAFIGQSITLDIEAVLKGMKLPNGRPDMEARFYLTHRRPRSTARESSGCATLSGVILIEAAGLRTLLKKAQSIPYVEMKITFEAWIAEGKKFTSGEGAAQALLNHFRIHATTDELRKKITGAIPKGWGYKFSTRGRKSGKRS